MNTAAERLLPGKSHLVLAVVSFSVAFLFAALPWAFDTDHVVVVSVCAIACASSVILFIRLLVGKLGNLKYLLLLPPAILCFSTYAAGQEWYLVVMITGGTIICSSLIARLVGHFSPLVCNVSL